MYQKTNDEDDMSCFTDQELAVIDYVCGKIKDLSSHDISELSHQQPGWQNHPHHSETIPYAEAFSIVGV